MTDYCKTCGSALSAETKPTRRARFVPPSRDEIVAYIKQKGYQVNPDLFLAHYESVGWKVGKNKMKSWRAALAGWHYRNAPPPKSESDGLCL